MTRPTSLQALPPGPHGLLSARPEPDLAALGYTETEYLLHGTANAMSDDVPPAGYATRVLVRAPGPEVAASGTVVVEWFNVSGGMDAAPAWTFLAEEVLRAGHAWAGVSAQHMGVEGGVGPVSVDGVGGTGLRAAADGRYADVVHPGDAYCYDVFTEAAEAVRDLLGATTVLGVGESQSAFALTTYVNEVQPRAGIVDGFLLHSRLAVSAPAGEPGRPFVIDDALGGAPVELRTDDHPHAVPVLTLQAEGDLFDRIDFLPARQDDGPRLRLWEVAGAAHADRYVIGEFEEVLGCAVPVNRGQQWAVARAALRALHAWVVDGVPPPSAARLELAPDGTDVARDEHGIARGGVRTPVVDAPAERVSGRSWPGASAACRLFGSTTPLDVPAFPDRAAYLAAYEAAADAMVAAGTGCPEDRAALLAEARPELLSD